MLVIKGDTMNKKMLILTVATGLVAGLSVPVTMAQDAPSQTQAKITSQDISTRLIAAATAFANANPNLSKAELCAGISTAVATEVRNLVSSGRSVNEFAINFEVNDIKVALEDDNDALNITSTADDQTASTVQVKVTNGSVIISDPEPVDPSDQNDGSSDFDPEGELSETPEETIIP